MPRQPHSNPRDKPSKSWCWTLNNYTGAEENGIQLWDVSRSIYGREVGANQTPHLQGFTTFKKAKRLSAVKKLLPRAHWEPAKSTSDAWDYCAKSGDCWFVDNRVGSGTRTDWKEYKQLIADGADDAELFAAQPALFIKFGGGTDRARAALQKPRHHQTICEWYYGDTGSGKSTLVDEKYPHADWCSLTRSGFFQGYKNAQTVVLDDPDLVAMQRELFLNLINKTPYVLNVKGSHAIWNAERLIILSNTDPALFHAADAAVQRRIHNRYRCYKENEEYKIETIAETMIS